MKKFFLLCGTAAVCASLAVPAAADTVLATRGTQIDGTLLQTLDSKTSHSGDTFSMSQKNTFFHHNAALSGATIDGHVENVTPAGPTHKATMSIIVAAGKLADGTTVPIQASVSSISPPTHHIRDAGLIVGGAVAGHMLASHNHVKHGGVAGAAAGFALATTLKSDIHVKAGTIVKMKLASDLVETGAASN
ncbi:MAG: hypothetical protein IAI48_18585 [Candidatus Eremiobacteraeota bacterium]|nr:hypothetical protein [Candidatus Eremiobacteraeota bacterium]